MDLSGLTQSMQGVLNTVSQGLSTPTKSVLSIGQNFGFTANDFSSPQALASKLGSVVSAYGPGGTAGLGHHVLSSALGRRDPLLSFNWFCDMPSVGGRQLPWSYVEEVNAPMRSFDVLSQYRSGIDTHYAGKMTVGNLSIKCYDDSTGLVGAYLEGWRNTVAGIKDGVFNYPAYYKKNITVTILDVSRAITVYTFKYIGCWPVSGDQYSLVSDQSARINPSQEFSVDTVEISVRDVPVSGLADAMYSSLSSSDFPSGFISQLTGTDNGIVSAARGLFSSSQSSDNWIPSPGAP